MNEYRIMDDFAVINIKQKSNVIHQVFVDLDDLELLRKLNYRWCVQYHSHTNSYYARTSVYTYDDDGKRKGKNVRMHVMLMNATGKLVDHINHNTLDNRRKNLRIIESNNNSKNRKGRNSNNKSGYRNVCWIEKDQLFVVQLQIEGRNRRLRSFKDVHEAGKYADEMRRKYYGEFKGES